MSSGARTAGVKPGDRDDLGHLLDPRMSGIGPLAGAGAVLGPQRDALAVGLHHEHVAGRRAGVRVAGPLGVEVVCPGGQVLGQAGHLSPADHHSGAGLDDFLGLSVAAFGQVIGGQGAHPEGVGVIGQHPPGIGRVQVRFAAVAVGQPGGPDRPEDADHAPVMTSFHAAVPDPCGAGDLLDALLARGVDGEGGFQQLPLQLPARIRDRFLPVPVIESAGVLRSPGEHRRELLYRAGQRRRQLTVHRARGPVLADLRHRHRNRHRRASVACRGSCSPHDPGTGPGTGGPGTRIPPRISPRQPAFTTTDQHRSPAVTPGAFRNVQTLHVSRG